MGLGSPRELTRPLKPAMRNNEMRRVFVSKHTRTNRSTIFTAFTLFPFQCVMSDTLKACGESVGEGKVEREKDNKKPERKKQRQTEKFGKERRSVA